MGPNLKDDVKFHCAFNFPAVLLTLGPSAWPKLKQTYETLTLDSNLQVRKTLAYSLFELAKIMGPDLTETELLPIFLHFVKDVDEVREGILVSLPEFIESLPADGRDAYVEHFAALWAPNEQNWRTRE